MIKRILLAFLLLATPVYADTVSLPTTYSTGGTVTASNLNNNFTSITAQVNGGLDNDNADASGGFRFYETKSSLPSAGTQGRVVFNTGNNTLNFDTGSAWTAAVAPSGSLATGVIPYYNSGWQLLTPGTQYYPLISNGTSSLPSYQQLDLTQGVTGTLPVANGGTGGATTTAALTSLLGISVTGAVDEDDMSSDSATLLPTQQSVKAYVDEGDSDISFTLISATTLSGDVNSGDISISSNKIYKVVFEFSTYKTAGPADRLVGLRFNSSGSGYNNLNTSSTNEIDLTGGVANECSNNANSAGIVFGQLLIDTTNKRADSAFINGESIYINGSTLNYAVANINAIWETNTTITDFEILMSASDCEMNGNIYVYELSQS